MDTEKKTLNDNLISWLNPTKLAMALLLAFCVLPIRAEDPPASQGKVLHYHGRLSLQGTQEAGKVVDWYVLVSPGTTALQTPTTSLWVVEEAGRGGWDWSRRSGRGGLVTEPNRPSLKYAHPSADYVVPLPNWGYDVAAWTPETTWEVAAEKLVFRVEDQTRKNGRPCWKAVARTPIGVKRTIWVDCQTGTLIALDERVFMGQGEQHDLRLELTSQEPIEAGVVASSWECVKRLDAFKEKLGARNDIGSVPWSEKQLDLLSEFSAPAVSWAPVKRLIQDIERDLQEHTNVAGALESLKRKAIGRSLAKSGFRDDTGKKVPFSSLKKTVTIFHFWEYRDRPLRPPYGQVGYLDFLYRRQDSEKVAVVGVAVHSTDDNPDDRRKSIRSARKLAQFMNISYPLVFDDGNVLNQIGDPRKFGVSLPVYVVVDRNGKIHDLHVGFYPVNREFGLKELQSTVTKLLADPSASED